MEDRKITKKNEEKQENRRKRIDETHFFSLNLLLLLLQGQQSIPQERFAFVCFHSKDLLLLASTSRYLVLSSELLLQALISFFKWKKQKNKKTKREEMGFGKIMGLDIHVVAWWISLYGVEKMGKYWKRGSLTTP